MKKLIYSTLDDVTASGATNRERTADARANLADARGVNTNSHLFLSLGAVAPRGNEIVEYVLLL